MVSVSEEKETDARDKLWFQQSLSETEAKELAATAQLYFDLLDGFIADRYVLLSGLWTALPTSSLAVMTARQIYLQKTFVNSTPYPPKPIPIASPSQCWRIWINLRAQFRQSMRFLRIEHITMLEYITSISNIAIGR